MASSLLYIQTTDIDSDSQLIYQEHKLQELIRKQVDLEYGVGDIMTIITLLIALGSMMFSLIANQRASTLRYSVIVAVVILLACLGYGGYAQYKISKDKSELQCQITQTLSAIQLYKQKPKTKE